MQIGEVRYADIADGVPVLAECLCFARRQKGEVRLIVGVNAGHEFDIRAVVVCEAPVPGIAEFVVAPGPLLLAWSNVVVCIGDGASAPSMVVAAEEIPRRPDDHVAGGNGDVGIPAQIVWSVAALRDVPLRHFLGRYTGAGALAVVDAIITALAERVFRNGAFGMIGSVTHVFREK